MSGARAFTLLELVLAMSLTAALVTVGLTLVVRLSDFWDRSAGRLAIESEARHVLDLLERDLVAVTWRRDGAVWLAATVQPDQPSEGGHAGLPGENWAAVGAGVAKPGADGGSLRLELELAGSRFGQAGVWLRLFTAASVEAEEMAGPVAVSYQLVRRSSSVATRPGYALFRAEVAAASCFATGYDLSPGTAYAEGEVAPGTPGNIRRPPVEALLANHVIDFGLRLFDASSGEAVFPTAEGLDYQPRAQDPFPGTAEVFVRIATPEGARQLALLEMGDGATGDWWRVAENHSLVFTRRIRLPQQVL